jgi:glycosyltransferase involved in cell wall biosynthesis
VSDASVEALFSAAIQASDPMPAPLHPVEGSSTTGAPQVSVVVPIYNEAQTLSALLAELASAMNALGRTWEVVLVDDGSTDETFDLLSDLPSSYDNVTVVRLRRNFGKAAALNAGFYYARGDLVVTMDSDLQDDPAEIGALLSKLDEGYDVASGWKVRRCDPWSRRVLSRIFNRLVVRATGLALHDVNCGLKAYRRSVIESIRIYGELHRFIPVLAHFEGYRITEVPVNHRPRVSGRSRYGLERYLRGLFDLLTVTFFGRYGYRPLHLFGSLGVLSSVAGFGICTYLTGLKLAGHAIGHRPLLVLGGLLVVVGLQMLMMGLIAEMLTRSHEQRSGPEKDVAAIRTPAQIRR